MTTPTLVIQRAKIERYLLNAAHPTGGSKAKFFLSHGFRPDNLDQLAKAIMDHAVSHWPGALVPSSWGERHELLGPMDLADGTRRNVLAIWEISHGEATGNFVTAYPQ